MYSLIFIAASLSLLAPGLAAQDNVLTLPRVGVIDFYGLRTVRETLVTQALGVRPGSPLPDSRLNAEERINDIESVLASHLEAVCCNAAGDVVLYVGIEEYDAPRYETRTPPGGADTLQQALIDVYQTPTDAARLTTLANANVAEMRRVLRESSDDLSRAAAAFLISFATPAPGIIGDLEYALRDANPSVRTVAVRRLVELSEAARRDPATRLRISPSLFVEMLNSLAWSDRIEAARALQVLTAPSANSGGDPATLSLIRAHALDAVIEMARWKTPEHARAAFVLVGRLAGMSDADTNTAFLRDERDRVIAAARARR